MKKLFAVLLALLILSAVAMPVFAAPSPGGQGNFTIDIYYHLDEVVKEHEEVPNASYYTFAPKDQPGYEFDNYELYTKDGTLIGTFNTLDEIKLYLAINGDTKDDADYSLADDIVIHVYYKEKTPVNPDPGPVSPPTGTNLLPYLALILVGLFGCAFAVRKLVKTH